MDVPKNQMPEFSLQEIAGTDSEVVKTPESIVQNEDKPVQEAVQTFEPLKGSLTPETKLYAALEQERALRREESQKRKELEQKLKEIELSSALSKLDDSELSEEGKALKQELASVKERLIASEKRSEEERVLTRYPQLKDKSDEFEEFRSSKNGMILEDIAQLFLLKNGLLENTPIRKGLEKVGGGPKIVESSGISASDVDRLMKNEPRKFIKMVRDGSIDPDSIK